MKSLWAHMLLVSLLAIGCSSSSFNGGATTTQSVDKAKVKAPGSEDAGKISDNIDADLPTDEDENNSVQAGLDSGLISEVEKGIVPQFALLVNNVTCSLCHVTVDGAVASVLEVPRLHYVAGNSATINGPWVAARGFIKNNQPLPFNDPLAGFTIDGKPGYQGVKENLKVGGILPKDVDKDGFADFPKIDFDTIAPAMNGYVSVNGEKVIDKVAAGNMVILGDDIAVFGEVLVKGDLVIKGTYSGIGNIYVAGNIYIPGNLRAETSAFPFTGDAVAIEEQAKNAIERKLPALGLATRNSILIGDYGFVDSLADFKEVFKPGVRSHKSIEGWFSDGIAGYQSLYDLTPFKHCRAEHQNKRSVSLVEAYLYAEKLLGGQSSSNSYEIRGGVIADHYHFISGAMYNTCNGDQPHPVHGKKVNRSYISYDHRMKHGLLLLKQLAPYFHDSQM